MLICALVEYALMTTSYVLGIFMDVELPGKQNKQKFLSSAYIVCAYVGGFPLK